MELERRRLVLSLRRPDESESPHPFHRQENSARQHGASAGASADAGRRDSVDCLLAIGECTGHALRCGPETSVTSPLRRLWFELSGHEKIYIQSSRPWECGNHEGISKECGEGGKPASWLSVLSILCHFHGLLFVRRCWITATSPSPMRRRRHETRIAIGSG